MCAFSFSRLILQYCPVSHFWRLSIEVDDHAFPSIYNQLWLISIFYLLSFRCCSTLTFRGRLVSLLYSLLQLLRMEYTQFLVIVNRDNSVYLNCLWIPFGCCMDYKYSESFQMYHIRCGRQMVADFSFISVLYTFIFPLKV